MAAAETRPGVASAETGPGVAEVETGLGDAAVHADVRDTPCWSGKTLPDKFGRSHVAISRAGKGAVFFASSRFSESTIAAHCNDIR